MEYDDETGALDFRFELGQGLAIFWATTAGRNDRLRLALADGAAFTVEEPVLYADPADFPRLEWTGLSLPVGLERRLRRVAVEVSSAPPRHRRELTVSADGGPDEVVVFAWTGRYPPPGPEAPMPR
ncbi:MAG: hypothetical protein AB1730_11735 [Myxococcota bacterium]